MISQPYIGPTIPKALSTMQNMKVLLQVIIFTPLTLLARQSMVAPILMPQNIFLKKAGALIKSPYSL